MFYSIPNEDALFLKMFEKAQRLLKKTEHRFTQVSKATGVALYKIAFINTNVHTNVTEKDLVDIVSFIENKPYAPYNPRNSAPKDKKAQEIEDIKLIIIEYILEHFKTKFVNINMFCRHLNVSTSYGSYINNRQTSNINLRILNKFYKELTGKDYPVPQRLKASLA